ncbi:radical SAM/SPASM domain-containing protein [Salidesulfovibrio onnuriiensis]|uniref:radical SAM/SPASM domain-containing protein n=1 Tax=Salidesulfovibrio onnuriiensis TaxID=2583823 RepID=UPI0011C7A2EA|nr:radical SAM/SPASM domain-containing protein [Salidesulfovibrio onnuriiensis]
MKKSETLVQFSCENSWEYLRNEMRRSRGKRLSYLVNRYQWKNYPRKKVPAFPLNVDIEASSRCQIQCAHCFRQQMDIGENDFMDLDLYKKIVAECGKHGLFTLKFSMRGEPLLHPDIVEMVDFAKKSGVKEVWINTNGGPLTPELSAGLIKAGTDWITMSFDGLHSTYEHVRYPLKYEASLKKLKTLREMRDKYKANTLLNVQSIWSAIKDNPQEYIDLMKSIVDRVAYNPDMNFKDVILTPDPKFVCPRLWQRICITSKGNYLKCPTDFCMEEIIGNAKTLGVKEAWDTVQEEQRQLHLAGRRLESRVCAKCHHGAIKKKVGVDIAGVHHDDFSYDYKEKFDGWGAENQPAPQTEREKG